MDTQLTLTCCLALKHHRLRWKLGERRYHRPKPTTNKLKLDFPKSSLGDTMQLHRRADKWKSRLRGIWGTLIISQGRKQECQIGHPPGVLIKGWPMQLNMFGLPPDRHSGIGASIIGHTRRCFPWDNPYPNPETQIRASANLKRNSYL